MRWIHFFSIAVVLIFAAQFIHYLIKGITYKFKNPFTPTVLALALAGIATVIHSYIF